MRIAIVEDQAQELERLASFIRRYFDAQGKTCQLTLFSDGDELLEDYRANWDLIFLDIQMARLDGMKTAEIIRQQDRNVLLVFVTNMAHYAIKGYGVHALDFLLKPVNYRMLEQVLQQAERLLGERSRKTITLPLQKGVALLDANHAVALEAAERSIVLLKNEGDILPLDRNASIALIGDFAATPRYQGAGSSMVNPSRLECTTDAIAKTFSRVRYAQGFTRADKWDDALADEALSIAKEADVVLAYLGLPEVAEAEGLERRHMRIPENQIRLLKGIAKVNPNVVVAFSGGSAVEMPWLDCCRGLLWLGLGGQAGAEAAIKVISGEVCPGGKLSETFVSRYETLPVSRNYPSAEPTSEYREGLFAGYRFTETFQAEVTFPLGYGLSYTSFAYDGVEATAQQVSFNLTNTGSRAGGEIAQVYVSLPGGQVLRPAKELKGFVRVHLEPGETRRVTIPLDDKAFRYFNVQTNRFEIEGGAWQVMVGASVRDIRLTAQVQVKGSGAPIPEQAKTSAMPRDLMAVTDAEFERLLGHPIPNGKRDPKQLGMNDPLDAMVDAKNPVARLVARMLLNMREKSIAAGKPDLNILFITSIPFRGIAKMMGGAVTVPMAEALRELANNH